MALPRQHRLQLTSEFRAVAKNAKSAKEGRLLLKAKRRGQERARFGIVVAKSVEKSAAKRNRLKRLLTEALRKEPRLLQLPYDIVLIALPGFEPKDLQEAHKLIQQIFKKAHLA